MKLSQSKILMTRNILRIPLKITKILRQVVKQNQKISLKYTHKNNISWRTVRVPENYRGITFEPMHFRIEVARALLAAQDDVPQSFIPRKRGRPSKENSRSKPSLSNLDSGDSMLPPSPKRKKVFQKAPPQEVRRDQKMHIPIFVQAKSAVRCKAKGCGKSSYISCQKCKVFLCVKRNSN